MNAAAIVTLAIQIISGLWSVVQSAIANSQATEAEVLAKLKATLDAEAARVGERLAEMQQARKDADAEIEDAAPPPAAPLIAAPVTPIATVEPK